MTKHPHNEARTAIAASNKTTDDTLGPECLVPSALVFGEFSKAYSRSETQSERASLEERARLAIHAQPEMETKDVQSKGEKSNTA